MWVEDLGPYKPKETPEANHPLSTLLNHMIENGVPIDMPHGMLQEEIKKAVAYGAYA